MKNNHKTKELNHLEEMVNFRVENSPDPPARTSDHRQLRATE